MRPSRIMVFLLFTAYNASAAWAQYGLYGSPDMLRYYRSRPPARIPRCSSPTEHRESIGPWVPTPAYQPAQASQVTTASYSQQYYVQPTGAGGLPESTRPPVPQLESVRLSRRPRRARRTRPSIRLRRPSHSHACRHRPQTRVLTDAATRAAPIAARSRATSEPPSSGPCADGSINWQPTGFCPWYASLFSALVLDRSEGRNDVDQL